MFPRILLFGFGRSLFFFYINRVREGFLLQSCPFFLLFIIFITRKRMTSSINNKSTSSLHSISQQDESSSIVKLDMRGDSLYTPHNDPENPFAFTPQQLSALQDPKNIELLHTYGGLEGVAKGLHANIHHGLDPSYKIDSNITLNDITFDKQQIKESASVAEPALQEDIEEEEDKSKKKLKKSPTALGLPPTPTGPFAKRMTIFGANVLPTVKGKNLFQLMWMAFNDKTLVRKRA